MLARPEIDKDFSILSANFKSSRMEGIERDVADFITAFDVFESMLRVFVAVLVQMLSGF